MNKHVLLFFMTLFYSIPIALVYCNYTDNNSVSNIICNKNNKRYVLFFMILMGITTILYELNRNDVYSQIVICVILFGIYLLIIFDESYTMHYFFAGLVFLSIIAFMMRHVLSTNYDRILVLFLLFAILLLSFILFKMNDDLFYTEVMYIINFAFFYFYLHFITC